MKNVDEIDFSAIQYRNSLDFVPFKKYSGVYILAGVVSLVSLLFLSFFGLAISFAIVSWYLAGKIKKAKAKVYKEFSEKNGWTYYQVKTDYRLPIGLIEAGNRPVASDFIEGSYDGNNFQIFDYTYVLGSGKNSRMVSATVFHVTINNFFPYILLDSVKNNGGARNIPKSAAQQKLEGDFNNFFRLYMDQKSAIDVLSIITPDVMQTVMQATNSYDIEIYNNDVFIYSNGDKRSKQYVRDLFIGVDKVMDQLHHKAKSYKALNIEQIVTTDLIPVSRSERVVKKVVMIYAMVIIILSISFVLFMIITLQNTLPVTP